MTTQTFTWVPVIEPTGTGTYRVLRAQFGDGYAQTAADGINNKSQTWPLQFRGTAAKITPIRDFLDACSGYQAFFWTPPLGAQGYYRCASYTLKPLGAGKYELAATFEQAFQP
ncbi:MAG: phage tail protein [Pseudomonadota bacterium]|nr:phage tail protein [Pseudomonadota bacterium]